MLLYHYTNIDAAINIIKNGLCFWGFRYDSMNDPTDCLFASKMIMPQLIKELSEEKKASRSNVYPYIVSFSTEKDSDIMWRLYHGEIALVIDSTKFPLDLWQKDGDFSDIIFNDKVEYATEDQVTDVAQTLYNRIHANIQNNHIFEWQLYVLPFIKHKSYEIEHEYRLTKIDYDSCIAVYNPQSSDNCEIYDCEVPHDVKCYGSQDGKLRLYKEFNLPKEALVGLIFYTFDDDKFHIQEQQFKLWLLQHHFNIQNITIEKTRSYPTK
jgi:hypothetical protein